MKTKISTYDTTKHKKLLNSNDVYYKYFGNQYLIESVNDVLKVYDSKYFVNINFRDSQILVIKNDTFNPNNFNINSFFKILDNFDAKFVKLSSIGSQIKVGIEVKDMPNDIVTYTVDTFSKRLVNQTMLKQIYTEDGIRAILVIVNYVEEKRLKMVSSFKISKEIFVENPNNNRELIFSEKFKKFKIKYQN